MLCFVLAGSHDRPRRVRLRCMCSFARCLSWTRKWSESYRTRIENLDWENRVIFVHDSKTTEGRRLVPMSRRVCDLLRARCGTTSAGWVFPSNHSASWQLSFAKSSSRQAELQRDHISQIRLSAVRRKDQSTPNGADSRISG